MLLALTSTWTTDAMPTTLRAPPLDARTSANTTSLPTPPLALSSLPGCPPSSLLLPTSGASPDSTARSHTREPVTTPTVTDTQWANPLSKLLSHIPTMNV
eukprot:Phypoly_transcript_17722.p2 GENE.Phypoly_transcript_17722~~Phypoly_transcript_17722.p2  ORF type:complete len:100 (+),score=9.50 Phypoly_transcript_17722:470-769(+)